MTTPDCHLIALNVKNGKVKWDVVIADSNKGYWSTNAPLVVRNHVLVGVSGDFDNLPGQLKSDLRRRMLARPTMNFLQHASTRRERTK